MCSIFLLILLAAPCFAGIPASASLFESTEGLFPSDWNDLSELEYRPARPSRVCQSELYANSADLSETEEEIILIPDPLESANSVFFLVNDKLYFWALKPVAIYYNEAVPEPLRVGVRNFFSNLRMPIRVVNCLLQSKFKGCGIELARFLVNSSMGVLGFGDAGKKEFNLEGQDEDLGQTLGFYGLGPGMYIDWPIFGPSSLRDTVGSFGDGFFSPLNYILDPTKYNMAVTGYELVNNNSLRLGEYESLKRAALDPYVSLRDAYHQYRQNKIKE
jgi:phospholipid-binding lipoprotein MlaA